MSRRRSQRRPQPQRGPHPIDFGTAALVPDDDGEGGWMVYINKVANSYVHLDDPTRLEFEYVQWAGRLLDVVAPAGEPIDAVHIGAGGCTLPLYTAATRPGSRQIVFEVDAALVTLMRSAFGLRAVKGLRVKTTDGLDGLVGLAESSADVVIRDAFDGWAVPSHLTTVEYHEQVARVLRPDGVYVANVADTVDVRESRVEAATALTVFDYVALVAEPAQFRGRRFGNVLTLASQAPLPEDALTRQLASGAVRARYVDHAQVRKLVAGVHPRREAGNRE